MSDYLNFQRAVDDQTTSWQRGDPDRAIIVKQSTTEYIVGLADGEDTHAVVFGMERGGYVGWCDCKGYEHHDGVCAHLATLRKAEFMGDRDHNGEPIEAGSTAVDNVEEAVSEPEPEIVPDGGRPVAGADGRLFGRPEGRL